MANIIMYAHGGSGNHGCEAIVRSTMGLIKNLSAEKFLLITDKPSEDEKYGLNLVCELIKEKSDYPHHTWDFISAYLKLKLKKDYVPLDKLQYKYAFDHIRSGDIAMSIGGDNYCYADVHRYIMMHDMALARGAKTVLWGCSVEPELLNDPTIAADIARYSLITARETISYEALKKVNPNTVLVPDPAFLLETAEVELPENFLVNNMVGINISPMIMENEKIPGITMKNYEELISYILSETDMGVALIPHVVWKGGDDRLPLQKLYEKFKTSGRIVLFDDQSCDKIKGVISKCRFFVGARTHATIAAYSNCIPTLVVGYSVKAIGIARDLFGTEEGYVLPVQQILDTCELLGAFKKIIKIEKTNNFNKTRTIMEYNKILDVINRFLL